LGAFYERRIRRIVPALLAVLLVTSVVAYETMIPGLFVDFAKSELAALGSFSNIYFWHEASYFDAASASRPLLHTWSLAVEEQFYLIFPMFLALVFRYCRQWLRLVLWATFFISLIAATVVTMSNETTAFYFFPLRAWELLAGTLISQHKWSIFERRVARECGATTGLLLILISGEFFKPGVLFPGPAAAVPCLGSVLIIAAGRYGSSIVGRMLSWKPAVFIGLISYSLYLWHWPLIVLQKDDLLLIDLPYGNKMAFVLLCASLALGTASWRFVETPFRRGSWKLARKPLLLGSFFVASILLVFAWKVISRDGFPNRFSPQALAVADFTSYGASLSSWRRGTCFLEPNNSFQDFDVRRCLRSDPVRKGYLIFGDSLAAGLYPGLVKVFPSLNFMQATSANCQPVFDSPKLASEYKKNCTSMRSYINSNYLHLHKIDAVILAGNWTAADLSGLQKEIEWIQENGSRVVVVGPPITFDVSLPLILTAEMRRSGDIQKDPFVLSSHVLPSSELLDKEMRRAAKTIWHVQYISYFENMCSSNTQALEGSGWTFGAGCPAFSGQEPVLFDSHHLTTSGSILMASGIRLRAQLEHSP
jgi:peptidoglycan/LPS O-acetylase OafA/YrhL